MERRRVSWGKPGSFKRRCLHLLVERLRARLVVSTSQGFTETKAPRSPGAQQPPPPLHGNGRPQKRRGHSPLPFLSQPDGLGLSPRSHHQATEARPANPHPLLGSSLPDPRPHLPPVLSAARP